MKNSVHPRSIFRVTGESKNTDSYHLLIVGKDCIDAAHIAMTQFPMIRVHAVEIVMDAVWA